MGVVNRVQYCSRNMPIQLVILVGVFTTRVISDDLPLTTVHLERAFEGNQCVWLPILPTVLGKLTFARATPRTR